MPTPTANLKNIIAAIHEDAEKTLASSFCDPDEEAFAGTMLALFDVAVAKSATADSAAEKRIGYLTFESKHLFFARRLRADLMNAYGCDVKLVGYSSEDMLACAQNGDFEYLVGRQSHLADVVDENVELISVTLPRTFKDASAVPPLPGM